MEYIPVLPGYIPVLPGYIPDPATMLQSRHVQAWKQKRDNTEVKSSRTTTVNSKGCADTCGTIIALDCSDS